MPEHTKDITLQEVQKIVQNTSAWKVVNALLEKGLISVYENLNENYKPKKENYLYFNEKYEQEQSLKELLDKFETKLHYQNLILTFLHLQQTTKMVSQHELLRKSAATTAQLKYLVDKEIFKVKKLEVDRVQFETVEEIQENILNDLQLEAYEKIKLSFSQQKPVLLQGITGSGKTHIYFQLIADCIAMGKQALYLLPEIALTTQIIKKLRATFGNTIGIYHSRFSNQERVELWRKVQTKQFNVVIGSRSALLLPFNQLGLIIVDEEHDTSYKQHEPAPRYHARDAAIYLALQLKANILLGTATPSMESYYNCKQGKYDLVSLTARYGNAVLPQTKIIDIKQEMVAKTYLNGIFSQTLIDAIQQSIIHHKQVILFQNRRGYAPFVQCELCGWVPQCKNCDVSLTYHKSTDQLHCHYCNTKSPLIQICMACGSNQIKAKSFGTEKIEEEIKKIFPHARVQRFDWDSLKIKNKYIETIRQFEKQEIDILVGTQMVVKGLDFEHVNLVGVLSADKLLSYPDFRVNERAFQMLEQVSGRAGRKDDQGQVLIQLFNTQHPLLHYIKNHDFEGFYQKEIDIRKEFLYPPIVRLIRIVLKHKQADIVKKAAEKLFDDLKDLPKTVFFGPAEPAVNRIKNYYIQEILLKTNRDSAHLAQIKKIVREKINYLTASNQLTTVFIYVDVDP